MQACDHHLNVIQQHHYRRTRKTIHLICFLIFVALPYAAALWLYLGAARRRSSDRRRGN